MTTVRDNLMEQLRAPLTFWLWLVASSLTAVAGPFGTYDVMSLGVRLIFWPGLSALAILVSFSVCSFLNVKTPWLDPLAHDATVTVSFSLLFTPFVMGALTLATPTDWLSDLSYVVLMIEVLAVTAILMTFHRMIKNRWPHLAATMLDPEGPNADAPPAPRLLRRLEVEATAEILHLTVNDHYVEVTLADQEPQRILLRFCDAVNEMDGVDGFCVHRSHWVARNAIEGVITVAGREVVALSNGAHVPISRTYRPNLIEAGLISSEPKRARAVG